MVCNKDLTDVNKLTDRIYTDHDNHIFCSVKCLGEWNTVSEFCSWEEYYQYFFE